MMDWYSLISAWLLTSVIGSIVSGVGNMVGGVISTTVQAVSDQLGPIIKNQFEDLDISFGDAKREFYSLLEDTGKEKPDPPLAQVPASQAGATCDLEMKSRVCNPVLTE